MSEKTSEDSAQQVERHLNLRIVPVLIGVFGILYGLTGFRGWLVIFLGTVGVWFVAILWTRSLEQNLRIDRKIHLAWATVGESVHEQIRLINTGWLPAVWVEVTDASTTLETPFRLVSDVAQHSSRTRHPSYLFKRRGLYALGPTRLRSGDPFGIYTLTLLDQHSSTILVTPPILPLAQLKISSGGPAGDGRRRAGAIERNISDAGVRNYVPGDSLRRIHWRASAHFDTLIVRQLEAATSRDWWIYADLDSSVQSGQGQFSTLELCIILAASLAERGYKERRRVGLVLAGPKLVWVEPGAGTVHRWQILRALSMAEAGKHSLADLVSLRQNTRSATRILITASTDPAWVAAASQCQEAGLFALLIDPREFGSQVDQNRITSALARSRISFTHMPGSLLKEAYASKGQVRNQPIHGKEIGQRYLQQGGTDWLKMD